MHSRAVLTAKEPRNGPISKGPAIQAISNGQEIFLDFLTVGDETDMLSRNVCKELQLYAA